MAGSGQPATVDDRLSDQSSRKDKLDSAENSSRDEGISMGSSAPSNSSGTQKDTQEDVMQVMMSNLAEHFLQPDTKNRKQVVKQLQSTLNSAIVVCNKNSEDADSLLSGENSDDSNDSKGSSISPKSPQEATSMPGETGGDVMVIPKSFLATEVMIK